MGPGEGTPGLGRLLGEGLHLLGERGDHGARFHPHPHRQPLTFPNQPWPISSRYKRLCRPRSVDLSSCTVRAAGGGGHSETPAQAASLPPAPSPGPLRGCLPSPFWAAALSPLPPLSRGCHQEQACCPGDVAQRAWEACAPGDRDKPGRRKQSLELGLAHRHCWAGGVAGAEAMGRRAAEWPVPSPLPRAGIPAPGVPKAPLLGAAWHSPVRHTLSPFSCRPGWVRSAGRKGQGC